MKYAGRTATAIIPCPKDTVLLIKRSTRPFVGYWALPGGRVESEETVEQTVVREVKEETGLDTEVVCKIGDYHEQGTQDGAEYDYYPACFLVKTIGGLLKKQRSEVQDIKLFSIGDIPKSLAFEHNLMIKDYIKLRETEKLTDLL